MLKLIFLYYLREPPRVDALLVLSYYGRANIHLLFPRIGYSRECFTQLRVRIEHLC